MLADHLSEAGAETLAARIQSYWLTERGLKPRVKIERVMAIGGNGQPRVFAVRSNMVNGQPRP